jgi:hypothetical protein
MEIEQRFQRIDQNLEPIRQSLDTTAERGFAGSGFAKPYDSAKQFQRTPFGNASYPTWHRFPNTCGLRGYVG